MENLEKIQEIGTTEKAWIEYAQAIDRNNENIRSTKGSTKANTTAIMPIDVSPTTITFSPT